MGCASGLWITLLASSSVSSTYEKYACGTSSLPPRYPLKAKWYNFGRLVLNMETIFAPWRMEYIKGEKPDGCVFCKHSIRCEEFILFEGKTTYVMMNRYPYVNGHLMIIPQRHIGKIEELTQEERKEIFNLLETAIKALKEAMKPDGFNIGANIGKAAGAGIKDHFHIHVIPRWEGDTNFMSVVTNVRVIPEDISKTAANLAPLLKVSPGGIISL